MSREDSVRGQNANGRNMTGVIPINEVPKEQNYGESPTKVRNTDHYQAEYVENFVERWDELIDWEARAEGEGRFFIDKLREMGKHEILDVAAGTGFHSVQLLKAGFSVTSADGNAQMLVKAFDNARAHGHILQSLHADWRWLNRSTLDQQYDAVICLGNSFTHLFDEHDRRRALAEFYSVLKHDGVLIIDQRNYDRILDEGFSTRHKYYYCGDRVSAEPIHVDDGLARFEYTFEDGAKHHLNMYPLRRNYMRGLISEAGFQNVETFDDFQESHPDNSPDFFVHIAHKDYHGK